MVESDTFFRAAYDAALRLLSYRPRSAAEVRRRMARRYPIVVVEQVITMLQEQHYLDDAAFASYWRERREQHRPKGREVLRQELLRLGVSGDTVNEALEGFDAAANAYRAGKKLVRRWAGSDYPEFQQRLSAYLRRRGFGGSLVSDTVQQLWQELSDSVGGQQNTQEDEK
jgi:regulatory protein